MRGSSTFRRGARVPVGSLPSVAKIASVARTSKNWHERDTALSDLCRRALGGAEIAALNQEAVHIASSALGLNLCSLFELTGDGKQFVLRAACEPQEKLIGVLMVPAEPDSPLELTPTPREPVILKDLRRRPGMQIPHWLQEWGVVSGISVCVPAQIGVFGFLCCCATEPREFDEGDVRFLQALANLLGVAIDRRHAQTAVQESDLRYRLMVEGSEQVFFYAHGSDYVVNYVSPSVRNVLGYDPSEVIGHSVEDFLVGDPSDQLALWITASALRDGNRRPPYLAVNRHRDGRHIILEAVESPILRDGRVIGMQGFARDVTLRVAAEKELHERTAYLSALIQHSPLGIAVVDAQNKVTLSNPAFECLFGYSQSEIVGSNLDDLIAPEGMLGECVRITDQVQGGQAVHTTGRRRRKDGGTVEVEIHGVPLIVDGEQKGSFALYQDLSERRQAEESLRQLSTRLFRLQDDERRRLARELHDTTAQDLVGLSILLSGVRQSAQPVLSPADRKALEESLTIAERSARELRTFSYLLHPPVLEEAGLASAVRWYVGGFSARSGIEVTLKISPKLGRLPRDVSLALFRVIQESLTNVHRHSGSPSAEIIMDRVGNTVRLKVKDDGKGFPRTAGTNLPIDQLGVGIAGMRERLQQVGGTLQLISDRGMTVRAVVPVVEGNV